MTGMAVTQNTGGESQTCGLRGCDNPITQSPGGGPLRKYCCSEHRREARKVRYEARTATAPEPRHSHGIEEPAAPAPKPSDAPGRPLAPVRHRGTGVRRGTRAALAIASLSAVFAALIPGDVGAPPTTADREQSRDRADGPRTVTAVDTTWVPRARRVLAQVDKDLAQIDKAEHAAAAVPRERWSARLRALMRRLEQRKADLLRLRTPLQADLSVVESYGQAAASLASTRQQLGLLNQARGPLRSLSGSAQKQMAWILNGLESQAGRLSEQERSHKNAEENLRTPAREASAKPLPDLPEDVRSLASRVNDAAEASAPPARSPAPIHPGGDGPRSDRPSSSPHRSPGKPTQTTAPPHPSPPASKKPKNPSQSPAEETPPNDDTPPRSAPPAAEPSVPSTPAQTMSDSSGGGGAADSVSDSSADSDSASDAGSDSGDDSGADSGSDGSDSGSDSGSDGGSGSDSGSDGGGF
jgi:outer membrane biosynthesis protein TonB